MKKSRETVNDFREDFEGRVNVLQAQYPLEEDNLAHWTLLQRTLAVAARTVEDRIERFLFQAGKKPAGSNLFQTSERSRETCSRGDVANGGTDLPPETSS